jgi:GalNAc-alpha-(1->4)-GalNAc-alpha-(1->3)-diNAcBac-PP-undecaprenol alpha-1,4-N-acetyl-D-galactosaminyltransferase
MVVMEKKILCLVIPSLQAGGMERVMSELATNFASKGDIEVHLVLYGISREIFYPIPDSINIHKPSFNFNNRWRLFYTIRTLFFLRRTIKKIIPKSILSFGEYWNSFVLLALLGLSYPVYISDRCSPEKKFNTFHSFLRKVLYPKAEGIIAQTELAKQFITGEFRHNNIAVIGNPIKQTFKNINHKEKKVLTVGRLIKSKNHDKLIEVFCKINKPGWKLVIVGGKALKQNMLEQLNKLIADLNVKSKVILAGYQDNIEKFYHQSSIFAFASSSEGFPNVIGEAMAAGLPTVALDCIAGPSEMIENEVNGFLIPINDFNTFRKRLEQLMSDESLRIRLGSRAKISIKKYSLENIARQYYDFILGT